MLWVSGALDGIEGHDAMKCCLNDGAIERPLATEADHRKSVFL